MWLRVIFGIASRNVERHSDRLEDESEGGAAQNDHAHLEPRSPTGASRDKSKDKTEILRVILSDHRPPILLPSYWLPPSSSPFPFFAVFYTCTPTLRARFCPNNTALSVHNEYGDSEPLHYALGYR